MAGNKHMEDYLICPHTSKPLRLLSAAEMEILRKRVEEGGLFFQKGVPLEFLPEKAYVTQNQIYIYLLNSYQNLRAISFIFMKLLGLK